MVFLERTHNKKLRMAWEEIGDKITLMWTMYR